MGGSEGPPRSSAPGCALNTGSEEGFCSALGGWGALEEVRVLITCKALMTLDLPVEKATGTWSIAGCCRLCPATVGYGDGSGWPTPRAPVAKPRLSLAKCRVWGQGPCSHGMLGVSGVGKASPKPPQVVVPLSPLGWSLCYKNFA